MDASLQCHSSSSSAHHHHHHHLPSPSPPPPPCPVLSCASVFRANTATGDLPGCLPTSMEYTAHPSHVATAGLTGGPGRPLPHPPPAAPPPVLPSPVARSLLLAHPPPPRTALFLLVAAAWPMAQKRRTAKSRPWRATGARRVRSQNEVSAEKRAHDRISSRISFFIQRPSPPARQSRPGPVPFGLSLLGRPPGLTSAQDLPSRAPVVDRLQWTRRVVAGWLDVVAV